MRLTNDLNLPAPIVEAISNDDYDRGRSDITVTQLISPPRMVALMAEHADDLSEDASDRIYALMGKAVHAILERADKRMLVEDRLYTECLGWTVGGAFDRMALLSGHGIATTLQDYKFASIYEAMFGLKDERVWQLNLLAELARRNGYPVERLEVVMIFRDWKKSEAARKSDYPSRQVHIFDVDVWSSERATAFMEARVKAHQNARQVLPECVDEERWYRGETYAVMKDGNKSATRVVNTEKEAADYIAWAAENKKNFDASKHAIVKRPGSHTRCENYCAVSEFCEQWARIQQQETS